LKVSVSAIPIIIQRDLVVVAEMENLILKCTMNWGLEVWLQWYSTEFESMKPWVQTPEPKKNHVELKRIQNNQSHLQKWRAGRVAQVLRVPA
jgi:hypothetical protein